METKTMMIASKFTQAILQSVISYSGLLGRPSKNIPISTSNYEEGNGTPYSHNITTTYDNLGRIISCNVSFEGTSSQVTYGY